MEERLKILIVDDEPHIVDSLAITFEDDFEVLTSTSPADAIGLLEKTDVAVVIADQRMPGMSGVEVMRRARDIRPDAVRVILSAYADIEDLITAINSGEVWRYLTKPWEPSELKVTVAQAADHFRLVRENARLTGELARAHEELKKDYAHLQREVETRYGFDEIVGKSPAMEKMFAVLSKVADSAVTVLIQGETGSGKELIARALHYNSSRAGAKFVVQNCGALPDTLLESELFGYKKGAFTGAANDKKGLFEVADGGTVFLDEIGETSPAMQVRLLRVLQEGEVRRVGELEPRFVDVRVVAATNKDLARLVEEGGFREDLFYRLNVISITAPPLRDRDGDVPLLASHFLERAAKKNGRTPPRVDEKAMAALKAYDFPGNARELQNEIERAMMLCDGETIKVSDLSDRLVNGPLLEAEASSAGGGLMEAVDHLKRNLIGDALAQCEGNKTKAADTLGLTRQSLQQMMKRLGME